MTPNVSITFRDARRTLTIKASPAHLAQALDSLAELDQAEAERVVAYMLDPSLKLDLSSKARSAVAILALLSDEEVHDAGEH